MRHIPVWPPSRFAGADVVAGACRAGGSPEAMALRSPRLFLRETLAGTVTSLALIPEVVSFSFVSGVDPRVALVASVVLALVMSVLGGRPAMVTAAAGSVALVIGPLVRAHGVGFVLPTVMLAGIVQIGFGFAGLARLMRLVPRAVTIGFVNALGILIFLAQLPHVLHGSWQIYPLFLLTVAIVLLLPRLTTAVPAALVAIVVVSIAAVAGHLQVPSVGGDAPPATGLSGLTPWLVPADLATLQIIWPTALSVAFVGLLETLLTAKLVDELTGTRSSKTRESWALGVANIAAGFYGGVAGCAMIGQTVVNVEIGHGRTRISTAVAGLVLLLLLTVLSGLLAAIPLVALAAVMMIVAIRTVNWRSLHPATLRRMPAAETAAMAVTVITTVATGNLMFGVVGGSLLALLLFVRHIASSLRVERMLADDGGVRYTLRGPLFYVSSADLADHFADGADPATVVLDLTHAQIWDASSFAALDGVEQKYRARGAAVTLTGLDARSAALRDRLIGIGRRSAG